MITLHGKKAAYSACGAHVQTEVNWIATAHNVLKQMRLNHRVWIGMRNTRKPDLEILIGRLNKQIRP